LVSPNSSGIMTQQFSDKASLLMLLLEISSNYQLS
jgi:hypothetical protein